MSWDLENVMRFIFSGTGSSSGSLPKADAIYGFSGQTNPSNNAPLTHALTHQRRYFMTCANRCRTGHCLRNLWKSEISMKLQKQDVLKCERLKPMERSAEVPLQWRHNDHDGVSNHQPHSCLRNRLFRRSSKKTSKLCVTGFCVGNSPKPVTSPHKGPVTRKMVPFDDVIMLLRFPPIATGASHCSFRINCRPLAVKESMTHQFQLYVIWLGQP